MLVYKNLWRNPSRTWLILTAIALVTSLIAILQAQIAGLEQSIYQQTIAHWVGKGQIKSADSDLFAENTHISSPHLPTLRTKGWLRTSKSLIPIQIWGIDTLYSKPITGLVIDSTLQHWLQISVGDSLAFSTLPTPQARITFFRVGQARQFNLPNSENLVILPLKIAQKFAGAEGQVSAFILPKSPTSAELTALDKNLTYQTWQKSLPEIAQMLALVRVTFMCVSVVLMSLLGLGICLIVAQIWQERRLELARLRILGMTRRQVWRMLMGELGILGGLGYSAGLAICAVCLAYLQAYPVALPATTAQSLQKMGFPATLAFSWEASVVAYPLVGLGIWGVILMFWALRFVKKM